MKKDSFGWSDKATTAFIEVKRAMCAAPIFEMSDFKRMFMLETDVSEFGLGEMLMQEGRYIPFYSRILDPRGQSKSVYEKELIVV